jgi:serpin B
MQRARNPLPDTLRILLLTVGLTLSACGGSDGASDDTQQPPPPPVNELRSNKPRTTAPAVSSEDAATLAHDNLTFSVDLYHELRSSESGNFIFSQTSISTALAMLYAGAATTTAEQMADALHFSLPAPRLHAAFNALDQALTSPPPTNNPAAFRLSVANSIWIQKDYTVLPGFLDTLAENYGAGLFTQDFMSAPEPARAAINRWVGFHTEDQIPTLFPQGSISNLTRVVLANALFFHGDWKVPFRKDSPNGTFHALSGDVLVPMMHGGGNAAIWSGSGWNAAALDYVGDTTSMIVVVPDAGTFAAFEGALTAELLGDMLVPASRIPGADLILPRFRFSTNASLIEILSALGMPDAFDDAADFSGITGTRELRVQSAVHTAIIAVDEKGTTASAATGVAAGVTSAPPTLVVDRPFLFFIRHNPTGAILFQGRVVDPSRQ